MCNYVELFESLLLVAQNPKEIPVMEFSQIVFAGESGSSELLRCQTGPSSFQTSWTRGAWDSAPLSLSAVQRIRSPPGVEQGALLTALSGWWMRA